MAYLEGQADFNMEHYEEMSEVRSENRELHIKVRCLEAEIERLKGQVERREEEVSDLRWAAYKGL